MNNNKRKILFSFRVYTEDPQYLNTSFQEIDDFEDEYIRIRDIEDEVQSLFVSPLAGSEDAYLKKNVHTASPSYEYDWMAMMYT